MMFLLSPEMLTEAMAARGQEARGVRRTGGSGGQGARRVRSS